MNQTIAKPKLRKLQKIQKLYINPDVTYQSEQYVLALEEKKVTHDWGKEPVNTFEFAKFAFCHKNNLLPPLLLNFF